MRILADTNVPEEHVSALRGDGHEVVYSRAVDELGPEATDDAIVDYAEREGVALLSTGVKDFGNRDVPVAVFVAMQGMSGGEVRAAVERIQSLPLDPADVKPLWLSGL